ncbi:MAG: response regulator transcription factor [Flavobacterium sp.]|nr:MAG: response regulator transcription factor [Flavobacterium sp.]
MIPSPTKIVVIHDTLKYNDPLIVELIDAHGEENVTLIEHSDEGLQYVLKNRTQKMIVILDLDLHDDEPQGIDIFRAIRKETSLVYIIIWTAKDINSLSKPNLVELVNNEFLSLEHSTTDYGRVLPLVTKAQHQLEVRVDTILEEWISNLSSEERAKPFMVSHQAEYTLEDLIKSIRLGEELGRNIERNILKLAVNLLTKQKIQFND